MEGPLEALLNAHAPLNLTASAHVTVWCWTCMKFQKPQLVKEKEGAGVMQLSAQETNSTQCTFLVLDLAATDEQKSVCSSSSKRVYRPRLYCAA